MTASTQPPSQRILGFDLARGLAIISMVLVNFNVSLSFSSPGDGALAWSLWLLEGRAAVVFVILAGVGVSIIAARRDLKTVQRTLLKRALFLLVIGYAWSPFWHGDILHFYGVWLGLAAFLVGRPSIWLWQVALLSIAGAMVLYVLGDYWGDWDLEKLEYPAFWSVSGQFRNLLFNGWFPLMPWMAYFVVGMWLWRQPLHDLRTRRRIGLLALEVGILAELCSRLLGRTLIENLPAWVWDDQSMQTIEWLYDFLATTIMPGGPFYVLSAGGLGVALVIGCLWLAEYFPRTTRPLTHTGQLTLTIYVAHVLLVLLPAEFYLFTEQSFLEVKYAVLLSVGFCIFAVSLATLWRRYYAKGPMEWLMRRLCG